MVSRVSRFNTVRLEKSKNHEKRECALSQSLRTLLEPLVVGRKSEARLFSFVNIQKAWRKIAINAGCACVLFHDLRRTSARSKRAESVDASVIMKMRGWRTDSMFRRYGIVGVDEMRDTMQKQEAWEKQQLSEAARVAQRSVTIAITSADREAGVVDDREMELSRP